MLRCLVLFFALLAAPSLFAQSSASELAGAWESRFSDGEGRPARLSMIITPTHMSMVAYYPESGEFIATLGGAWRADTETFSITYEYDSSDSTNVGSVASMPYRLEGRLLMFNGDKVWTRVDDGTGPGRLAGAWQIVGRRVDGTMRDLSDRKDGPRKTMKILSGERFQWIAFDTKKKQFLATGGGTYTTDPETGLYIEKIQYFSRDPERVGTQLSFDYDLVDGVWKHRGTSSQGDPLFELWAKR